MASEFIGFTILVTLTHPRNAQIEGVVADVVNQKLYLQNVLFLENGQRLPTFILDASAIADLEVAPSHTQSSTDLLTPTATTHRERIPSIQTQSQFVDPAILSYAKPPSRPFQPPLQPVSPIMMADTAIPSPMSVSQAELGRRQATKQSSVSSIATTLPHSQKVRGRRDSQATAVLTEPFDALAVGDEVDVDKKKSKQSKHRPANSQTGPGIIDVKDLNGPLQAANAKTKKQGKGKGWRQTPLIEEIPTATKQPRKQRGRRQAEQDANGWATEDATDIQDLPEFDFASNLSKFNKRQVFDDIRRDDTTADDERLVSLNRKPRGGTNGGKNLHWTENVLESPQAGEVWNSEAGETENDGREELDHYSSGRGSKRAGSRRPLQSRKGSVLLNLNQIQVERTMTTSPRPLAKAAQTTSINGSVTGVKASLRLANNKPCHCVSPLQMLEVETLCTSEMEMTEDMLSENAGRGIAEAVLQSSTWAEVRNVAVLVGNHKSGARAIAAARHLRNRRLRVTVVVLGGEREEILLEVVRRQLSIYRKGQGYVDRWDEFQSKITAGAPQPDVVVDAILGVHAAFDELRTDDQATTFEMIRWASRTPNVLSVDVPSGLSATSGLITEAEGQLLVMNSKTVIALGAPKIGLLHAMAMDGAEVASSWSVLIADIGIPTAVWQKHGSRRKHGVEFGGEWVVGVRFVSG